jgi:pilus assembly protein CpaB
MLRVIILVVAVAAGSAAAWMAFSLRGKPTVVTEVKPTPPPPMQDVLVASADIGLGERLTKQNMRWQAWPESALNPTYITRNARSDALDALTGALVRSRMAAGEPIREVNLTPLNAGFLSVRLPAGMRAIAVPISAQNTAGGFILPNDRVDVILTLTHEGSEPVSRTVLRNIPVLAIDQTIDERSKDKAAAIVGKTATLELDPSQVEILTAAEVQGTLSLALRSAADNSERPAPREASQIVKFFKIGRIDVVEIGPSDNPVELAASKKTSNGATAPEQNMLREAQ